MPARAVIMYNRLRVSLHSILYNKVTIYNTTFTALQWRWRC